MVNRAELPPIRVLVCSTCGRVLSASRRGCCLHAPPAPSVTDILARAALIRAENGERMRSLRFSRRDRWTEKRRKEP